MKFGAFVPQGWRMDLVGVPPEERPALLAEVRDELRPHLCDGEGVWTADYVRLRFAATRP